MNTDFRGVNKLQLDQPTQVEYNRRKNVEQDTQIEQLRTDVNTLLTQSPAGFLPVVFYGVTRGQQTYRFSTNYVITVNDTIPGELGDAFSLNSNLETENYIPAVAIKTDDNQITVIIKGDYTRQTNSFEILNLKTGGTLDIITESLPALQPASYLGDYPAQDNQNKQITVLYDLELDTENAVFASVDYSGDNVYNWINIGKYTNGRNGLNFYTISSTANIQYMKAEEGFLWTGDTTTYLSYTFNKYDIFLVTDNNPITLSLQGNVKGPQGEQGAQGIPGQDGANGYTPYIQDNYWYINGTNTGVVAVGQNGTDGQNGQAFNIQSGLYSTPANWGETGNEDPDGNALLQLPTLPQSDISGKGYVVYDPLTTPLAPYYDLYWANNGDVAWTIMHPFSGIKGQDGTNGYTPYIQSGYWYINGTSTGVLATGPQGPSGVSVNWRGTWTSGNDYTINDMVAYNGSSYICYANITGSVTAPPSDTTHFALSAAGSPNTIPDGGTTGQALVKASNTDGDTTWGNVVTPTDYATTSSYGVVKVAQGRGLDFLSDGGLFVDVAGDAQITNRTVGRPIPTSGLNFAVKSALTDSNHMTMTSAEQAVAKSVLGFASVKTISTTFSISTNTITQGRYYDLGFRKETVLTLTDSITTDDLKGLMGNIQLYGTALGFDAWSGDFNLNTIGIKKAVSLIPTYMFGMLLNTSQNAEHALMSISVSNQATFNTIRIYTVNTPYLQTGNNNTIIFNILS